MSDEQFDESAAVPSDEGAAEQFGRELDALRRKYEELGLDFDAVVEEHLAVEATRQLKPGTRWASAGASGPLPVHPSPEDGRRWGGGPYAGLRRLDERGLPW